MLQTLGTYLVPLGQGAVWTLGLFFSSAFLAVALGLVTCYARLSDTPWLRGVAKTYIEIIRGTPLLVQLFFIHYGLAEIGIVMPGFVAGTLGLSLNFGAYLAEL